MQTLCFSLEIFEMEDFSHQDYIDRSRLAFSCVQYDSLLGAGKRGGADVEHLLCQQNVLFLVKLLVCATVAASVDPSEGQEHVLDVLQSTPQQANHAPIRV